MTSTWREDLLDFQMVLDLFDPHGMIFLGVSLGILICAYYIYKFVVPFELDKELTQHDNKAVAISFTGFMVGVLIVLHGVMTSPSMETVGALTQDSSQISQLFVFFVELASTLGWSLGAVLLLILSRILNDKLLLYTFKNTKEIVEDKNLGTAAVEFGSYIGSALILHAALGGEDTSFWLSILGALLYYSVAQLCFILFGYLYQKMTKYCLHDEIEKDNAAAGVSFGMNLVANAVLLSGFLKHSDSLPGLVVWAFLANFLLFASRLIVDKVILPGDSLDDEISRDKNWGAAFIEGSVAIGLSLIVNASFFS